MGALDTGNRPARLAIVTCLKNEGPDLVEWLCFHRQIGVSRFVIYDNGSTDATRRILAKVPFRDGISLHTVDGDMPQIIAFNDAIVRYRAELDWAAFLDGDEFLTPLGERTILETLSEFAADGVAGLGVRWRIFGSNGHQTRPPGLLTESFTRRAEDQLIHNTHVKSLVRLKHVTSLLNVHCCAVDGDYRLEDGSKPEANFAGRIARSYSCRNFAIHHYITKSHEQCIAKIARGRPVITRQGRKFRPADYWETFDRNEITDTRAAQVIAPIRAEVLKLRDQLGRD